MGGAGSGRYKKRIVGELTPLKTRNLNFKLDFFKACDEYMKEYSIQQIKNERVLYKYMSDLFNGITGQKFTRLINEYKKKRD